MARCAQITVTLLLIIFVCVTVPLKRDPLHCTKTTSSRVYKSLSARFVLRYNRRMKFRDLALYFERIESVSARNEKTVILAEILKESSEDEIDKLVYLALGGLRPAFDRLEFNLAEKMIVRGIAQSVGKTTQEVEVHYQKMGDLGAMIVALKNEAQQKNLSELRVDEVYLTLEGIAQDHGSGSQERKVSTLAKLLKLVDSQSAKYIVRIVAGKLRLGFSDKTVLDALSYMQSGNKEFSDLLDRGYQIRPDIGVLAKQVKQKGVEAAVASMDIALGTPIVPALAQRLKTASEMIEKMGRVYVEPKFDGTRVQIHFGRTLPSRDSSTDQTSNQGGLFAVENTPQFYVRTFTRNLDESSDMFPELQHIESQIKAETVILDSEAVGYDPKTNKLVPFQLTITRKRKHGIADAQESVPLRFFVFDIMYLNGKSLIHLPLSERRDILKKTIQGGEILQVDQHLETNSPDELRAYHKQQLEAGLEGALVKQMSGEYMPGRTGFNWVKFKEAEDSRAKLSDTIDGVIMGYYSGKGKRSTFGLGAFLIGIKFGEKIVTLAKVGTGISDKQFGELFERLKASTTEKRDDRYVVPKILEPDVWVAPNIVVEVAADEITVSPTHTAGYALRFPRLVKFRDDKSSEEITTLDEIESMAGI